MDARPSRPRTPNPLLAGEGERVERYVRATSAGRCSAQADAPTAGNAYASSAGLTQTDFDSFKALGAEVHFEHPEWGEFWLVPEYTDEERLEITPEHIAKVSAALRAFGGKVVRFGRIQDEPEATAFSLAAARAHLRRLTRAQAGAGGSR